MYVIGIDPGPITGIVRIHTRKGVDALQVTPGAVKAVLTALYEHAWNKPAVAVERFVVGPRAARSRTPSGGTAARDVVTLIADWAALNNLAFHDRSAAEVKPWASDARLEAAGLLELTAGMRHARDAARHALFCAVRDYGLPDPLSARAGAR